MKPLIQQFRSFERTFASTVGSLIILVLAFACFAFAGAAATVGVLIVLKLLGAA